MKLTHHKDGTYSITGMTRDDVSCLSFATMLANHWHRSDERKTDTWSDQEWMANRAVQYGRITHVLDDASRWVGQADTETKYLPRGRSVEMDSGPFCGDPGRWLVGKDGREYGQRRPD